MSKILQWINKGLLCNIPALLKNLFLGFGLIKPIAKYLIQEQQHILDETNKTTFQEGREKFEAKIKNLDIKAANNSIRNVVYFSYGAWILAMINIFVSIMYLSLYSIIYSAAISAFAYFGLGFTLWQVRHRVIMPYTYYLKHIKKDFKQGLPFDGLNIIKIKGK